MINTIDYASTLNTDVKNNIVYIDTRSPGEFEKDHIPNSKNIAIFDDEERAIVGIIYARISVDDAFDKGKEIYDKKITQIKEQLMEYKGSKLIIYCWRGGMRSKVITELADEIGLDAIQLKGGYKSYRKYVRETLDSFKLKPKLVVLHGLTGSGKTDLLSLFSTMIDLEGLAQHRSSVYGSIGLKPKSQKAFESMLLAKLQELNDEEYILIEGESRKIGNVIMPEFLYKEMKKGINIRVNCSFESRARRLAKIYIGNKRDMQKTKDITKSLAKKIGKKTVNEMLKCLDENQVTDFMKLILEKYYDPLYKYSIDKIDYSMSVDTDNMEEAKKQLEQKFF